VQVVDKHDEKYTLEKFFLNVLLSVICHIDRTKDYFRQLNRSSRNHALKIWLLFLAERYPLCQSRYLPPAAEAV